MKSTNLLRINGDPLCGYDVPQKLDVIVCKRRIGYFFIELVPPMNLQKFAYMFLAVFWIFAVDLNVDQIYDYRFVDQTTQHRVH